MPITQKKTALMTRTAIMTAFLCILGPLSIPIGPVPVSFSNFVIFLSVFLLGRKLGTLSYILYLLLGLVGLPVFSGFSGGPEKLAGPTGGYLIGFILMAYLSGIFIEHYFPRKIPCFLGMLLGSAVTYLAGTLWLSFSLGTSFSGAFAIGVAPFLAVDLLKIILALMIGSSLRSRLMLSGSIPKRHVFPKS
jgi:biotin transport system substrate-specific component